MEICIFFFFCEQADNPVAGMPTQEDDAEELSLQEQVRALHHHLAARDAEVAALEQRECS